MAETPVETAPRGDDEPLQLSFHYLKSNQFRVIHADGAWGGLTLNGQLTMVLYSERPPIPKSTTHEVRDGRLVELEEYRDARDASAVREAEVAAIMHPRVAVQLRDWLNERLTQWEEIRDGRNSVESGTTVEEDSEESN
jgi:hypothetical protein